MMYSEMLFIGEEDGDAGSLLLLMLLLMMDMYPSELTYWRGVLSGPKTCPVGPDMKFVRDPAAAMRS